MDIAKLTQLAQNLKEETSKKGNSGGEWPNVTFLPEGEHKGRFISDPDDELYIKYNSYGYFSKGIRDPEDCVDLPEGFYNNLKDLAEDLADNHMKWGRRKKSNFLVYFYLTETDSPDERWKPNNLYCVLGNWRFEQAFSNMINSLVKDAPDKLMSSLKPSLEGNLMSINNVVDGQKSSCTISPLYSTCPPLVKLSEEQMKLSESERKEIIAEKMGELGYKSLAYSYIHPGFNQERYNNLVKAYQDELLDLRASKARKEGIAPAEDTAEVAPAPVAAAPMTPPPVAPASVEAVIPQPVAADPLATVSDNPFDKFNRK